MAITKWGKNIWKSLVRNDELKSEDDIKSPVKNVGRVKKSDQDDSTDETSESSQNDNEETFIHKGSELDAPEDPLDIAQIDPIEKTPTRKKKINITSTKEFFGDELNSRYDALSTNQQESFFGTYRLELKGYQGGIWTLKIDAESKLVVVNRKEEADVVVTMPQKDFILLVNGDLNPQIALFANRMKFGGDIKKAIKFQDLLVPV